MLGQLLPKMPSLATLNVSRLDGGVVPAEQMERLFDGFNKTIGSLRSYYGDAEDNVD